jgi:hypothetical protein
MAGRERWARRAVEQDDGTAFSLIQFKSACTQIGPPEVSPKMHSARRPAEICRASMAARCRSAQPGRSG